MTTHASHPAGAPCWADLQSTDPARARAFYTALFGWDYQVSGPEMGHYAMARLGGRQVAGMGGMPPGAPQPSAWTVYFASADIAATLTTVRANGGQPIMGPLPVADQGVLAVAADPSGAVFGLWQPGAHHGFQVTEEAGAPFWFEVNTRDVPAARDFYAKVFGYVTTEIPGMGYHTLDLGGQSLGGVMPMPPGIPPEVPAHWLVYFMVDDVDATVAAATAAGGAVLAPPMDIPYGRFAVLADPEGAAFAVMKPAMPAT